MDIVAIIKFVSLLLYPLGLVFVCAGLGFLYFIRRRPIAAKRFWIVGFILLWVFSTPIFSVGLTAWLEAKNPPQPVNSYGAHDAIVVMGGGLRLPSPPANRVQLTSASDRYWVASKLYAAGKAPFVVLLGGNLFEQPGIAAESEYARDLLIDWGVPIEAIVVETKSRTSEQNIAQFELLLKDNPKFSKESLDVILVTSATHMPRSKYLMRSRLKERVNITPASADVLIIATGDPSFKYWMPNTGALGLAGVAVHELYGLWFVQLKAFIKEYL